MQEIKLMKYSAEDISVIINELQNTSGTNDKKLLLENHVGHEELYTYLRYVYDEVNYVYGKSKLPIIPDTGTYDINDDDLSELYAMVNYMNDGILKGNSSDAAMQDYCVGKSLYYQDLLFYIIKRNIKASINAKGLNEVFGRIIPIAPYMRCESESYMQKRIKYGTVNEHGQIDNHGALAQSKADGSFLNCVIVPEAETILTTRYGRHVDASSFLNNLNLICDLMDFKIPMVIHGEALVKNKDGTIMNRAKGNGMLNKFYKRESTLKELQNKYDKCKSEKCENKLEEEMNTKIEEWQYIADNMVYEVWDILPYDAWINLEYSETSISRFRLIEKCVMEFESHVLNSKIDVGNCELRLIDHEIVYNDEQAMDFYQRQLDVGLEGMVIKNIYSTWEHDTNRQGCIKLKDFKECDLIITGYKMADDDSTFAGGIGSLICESSDGEMIVNVSGMKRHERGLERVDDLDSSKGLKVIDDFDFDQFTGKIAAVKFNELQKSKNKETFSLFLPNVLEVRDASDKSQPDTLVKIKKDAKYKS